MNLSGIFSSYPGMYVAQSFFHLLVGAIIIDGAIRVWKISDPLITQRLRFLVVIFPIFSFPLYQLVNSRRGSIFFRQEALFDSNRWLYLAPWGTVSLGILFLFVLFFTSVIFLVQELLPVLRHTLQSGGSMGGEIKVCDNLPVMMALAKLSGDKPETVVFDDEENIIYSTTGSRAAVYISSSLVKTLSAEEMEAAVAHEMAHIERSRRPMLFVVFLLRIAMFFNPLVLLEFRRATHDEEKICDDMAVSLTGKPRVLAETLRKLYGEPGESGKNPHMPEISNLRNSLEDYSHFIHIQSRIERLEKMGTNGGSGEWLTFSLALAAMAIINYFVV